MPSTNAYGRTNKRMAMVVMVVLVMLALLAGPAAAGPLRPPVQRTWVRSGTTWPYDRSSWWSATSGGYYWTPGVGCTRYGWSTRVVCH